MNINGPSDNLKCQLEIIDLKLTSDYKRVKGCKNTDRVYDSKVKEFLQFCDLTHPDEYYPSVITTNKVFQLLYYYVFRGGNIL